MIDDEKARSPAAARAFTPAALLRLRAQAFRPRVIGRGPGIDGLRAVQDSMTAVSFFDTVTVGVHELESRCLSIPTGFEEGGIDQLVGETCRVLAMSPQEPQTGYKQIGHDIAQLKSLLSQEAFACLRGGMAARPGWHDPRRPPPPPLPRGQPFKLWRRPLFPFYAY